MHTLVVLVENSASTARLTKFLLKAFNAEVEIAETGSAAIEKAMKTAYDVILMDIELPDMDGCEVTRQLRQRGYSGLIVATSALTRKEDADRCIAAGCDKHVAKPLSKETLWEILSSLSEEPSVSAFDNDPAMADMIDAYVQELPTKVRAVEEAMSMQDAKRVESITRALKAEGTSFGFGAISELAAKIENTLIDGAALANVQREIKTLVRLCLHARSSAKSRPPANASGVGESTERRTPPSAPTPH
jgi:CheY-like chemotaxis protein